MYEIITIVLLTTIVYLLLFKDKDFTPNLSTPLIDESKQVNNLAEPQIDIEAERREYLARRDRRVINDVMTPPEQRQQQHAYPYSHVKQHINIPTRGLPDNFQAVGTLIRKGDERVLLLFGRQRFPGSSQWEYYVSGLETTGHPIKMPIEPPGMREIENGTEFTIPWLDESRGPFQVNLYPNDMPRYNPFIF